MIRILHVVPVLAVGGIELALARVVRGLGAPAFEHSIACLTGEAAVAREFGPGVAIHCLRGDVDPLGQEWRLRRLMRDLAPAVVHARNVSAWLDAALMRMTLRSRPALILSFHGTDRAGALPPMKRLLAAAAAASATNVFTVSEASRELLIRWLGRPRDRIGVIPNGIDASRFTPGPARSGSGFVIGTVGGLAPVKNQALLVRACAELIDRGHSVELRIAGDGGERGRLTELARSLGISQAVHLVGYVADVPAFLQSLDVFVLPSDSEAHPNALIEAMACGLPCVASRVGGMPEVLSDGVGRMFDRGDLAALVEALVELIAAPDVRAALGRHARKRVEERYALDDMIRRYEQLYAEAAAA